MVAILPDHGIAYFGIHKAASSSVKHALYELREGHPWPGNIMKVHKQLPTRRVAPSDFEDCSKMWKFTVLRDPIKRFLSAYQNRIVDFRDLVINPNPGNFNYIFKKMGWKLSVPPRLGLQSKPNIENFIKHFSAYTAASKSVWIHTCPASLFIGEDLSYFDAVYTTSTLDQLEKDLSDRLNRPITLPRINESGSKPPRFEDLSQLAQDFLLKHTEDDYRLFSDFYAPPSADTAST